MRGGSLFPVLQEEEKKKKNLANETSSSAVIRKEDAMDMSWLRNDSARHVEAPMNEGIHSEDEEDDSSPWSSEEEVQKKSTKRKSRKRKSKQKKEKLKKRKLTDREKIRQIEEKLTSREKHKRTRKLRLYYWGDDFDVDVDVRKQKTVWAEDKAAKKIFQIDKMGNNDNLLYEQLYRLDVPNYFAIRDFFLGGDHLPQYLVRSILTDKGAGELGNEVKVNIGNRYFARKHELRDRDRSLRRIYIRSEAKDEQNAVLDYLPLEADEADTKTGQTYEERQLEKTKNFSIKLREEPHNIKAWFDFIHFQDESMMDHRSNKTAPILEKKISIYEKAIESNPGNVQLILGYLGTCRQHWTPEKVLGKWEDILDQHKESSRLWKEYLLFCQSEFETFSVMKSVDLYKAAIRTLVQRRTQIILQNGNTPPKPGRNPQFDEVESAIVSLLVRNAVFHQQAGYTEKGIALLQAVLEFNLFCPEALKTFDAKMPFFEAFWDSDSPRIGDDEKALTWRGWYEKQVKIHKGELSEEDQPQGDPHPVNSEKKQNSTSQDPVLSWIEKETFMGETRWLPVRGMDENDDEDLDESSLQRVVLMEDIKPFICEITNRGLIADVSCQLLLMVGVSQRVIGGNYRLSSYRHSVERAQELEMFEDVPGLDGRETQMGYFDISVRIPDEKEQILPQRPPSGIELLATTNQMGKRESRTLQNGREEFARRLLRTLIGGPFRHSISLRCTYLSFEAQFSFETSRDEARKLLKDDQMNLRLWNAYAQLLKLYKKYKEAGKIYEQALSHVPDLPAKIQRNAPLLFWSFAEIQIFDMKKNNAAMHLLAAAPFFKLQTKKFKKKVKSTILAKAQKMYQKLLGSTPSSTPSILQSKWDNANFDPRSWNIWKVAASASEERSQRYLPVSPGACLGVCFAWMEYFRDGIEAAKKVFDTHIFNRVRSAGVASKMTDVIVKGSLQHEWLQIALVRLITYHSLRVPTPPRILRLALTSALSTFPSNAYFLSTFIKAEGEHGHMTTRLRRHFDSVLDDHGGSQEISPVLWLYATVWELPRAGARHRLIGLFEKAVRGRARSTVAIWRLYLRYLIFIGALDLAKSTFYRAFNQCPWSKLLWMDGIQLVREQGFLDSTEFQELVNLMSEKEIRLHCPSLGASPEEDSRSMEEEQGTDE